MFVDATEHCYHHGLQEPPYGFRVATKTGSETSTGHTRSITFRGQKRLSVKKELLLQKIRGNQF